MTAGLLLDSLAPDFAEFVRVLKGEQSPRRVCLVEFLLDEEIMQAITERYLGRDWIPSKAGQPELYYPQLATLYYRLGYDYVPVSSWPDTWRNHPSPGWQPTQDTAGLSRGEREWANEGYGLITSWADFERFPWDAIQPDYAPFEIVARHLPPGMKIAAETNFFEHILETLLGYEGLFYLLFDDPGLVAAVFSRWGQKTYDYYQSLVGLEEVGALFHADDTGFKTSTLIAPAALREHLFPWLRKFAALAHAHGKPFWLHSCGNHYKPGTIEDLIDDIQIDALHSFQDEILSVCDFKVRYGARVAALGGVDVDKLVRLDEAELRRYTRDILDRCMPGGRFALGSGNTITNYVPLENYFVLLEESRRWRQT